LLLIRNIININNNYYIMHIITLTIIIILSILLIILILRDVWVITLRECVYLYWTRLFALHC